jgi:nitrite reductase (NO-forming)
MVSGGSRDALTKTHRTEAKVSETVRIAFRGGGPNFTSWCHVIGAILGRVHNLDEVAPPHR